MFYRSFVLLLCLLAGCTNTGLSVIPVPLPTATNASPAAPPVGACGARIGDSLPVEVGTMPAMSYDDDEHTITLEGEGRMTLAALATALDQPELLRELAPGEWYLAANVRVADEAELVVAGPQVRRLKLRSDEGGFVWIRATGGRLTFADTCVSSWDAEQEAVDRNTADGRSYVLARDGATMHIRRSTMQYLGYMADESYGVAYRLAGSGGEVIDSDLSYNYYGLYSYEVNGLIIRNNDVHHNVMYGIDPHTNSNRLLIEGNRAYANGKHGIILAEGCSDSIIRNNYAYDNGLHGIVLYDGSNHNLVEGNVAYHNGLQGINVNNADRNLIRGNTVYENSEDGIGVGQAAKDNLLVGNTSRDNRRHGIYLYSNAQGTLIAENTIIANREYGIYVKSAANRITDGNRISANQVGVYINTDDPPEIVRERNDISDNRENDIVTQ